MMDTDTDLANAALDLIGEDPIDTLFPVDEDAADAPLLKIHRAAQRAYAPSVEFILQQRNWSRAHGVAQLAALSDAVDDQFERVFQLPHDCVRVKAVTAAGGGTHYRWTRRAGPERGRIASDAPGGSRLAYVALIDPPAMGAALFDACVARLAVNLAIVKSESRSKLDQLRGLMRDRYKEAMRQDASERSSTNALTGSRHLTAMRDGYGHGDIDPGPFE